MASNRFESMTFTVDHYVRMEEICGCTDNDKGCLLRDAEFYLGMRYDAPEISQQAARVAKAIYREVERGNMTIETTTTG